MELKKSDRTFLVNTDSDFFNPNIGCRGLTGTCLNGEDLYSEGILFNSDVEACYIFDEDESFIAESILEVLKPE